MALILHIETGTNICSVALSRGEEQLSLRESDAGRDHATKLGVFIDEILKEQSCSADDLNAISVSMGPGSYTGLRIGVSMAKGLCYALGIPLIGIGSLESLANVAKEDYEAGLIDVNDWSQALLSPMIDARRMEVYAQVFDSSLNQQTKPFAEIINEESFAEYIENSSKFVIFGDGAAKTVDFWRDGKVVLVNVTPSARGLVKIAYKAYLAEKFEDIAYFEPLYLKDFIVQKSTKKIF